MGFTLLCPLVRCAAPLARCAGTPRASGSPAKHTRLAPLHVDLRTSFDEGHQRGPAWVLAQVPVGQFT